MKIYLLISCFFLLSLHSSAKNENPNSYTYFRDLTEQEKKELKQYFKKNIRISINSRTYKTNKTDLANDFKRRADWLSKKVDNNDFVREPELDSLVINILNHLRLTHPTAFYPKKILIDKNFDVNAYCTGEGTLILNIGIIQRLNTIEELAFVISHEISHQLLDHVNTKIEESHNAKMIRQKVSEIRKASNVNGNEVLNAYKKIIYGDFRKNSKLEKQADSLGYLMLIKSKFYANKYSDVLTMLDSSDYPANRYKPNIKKTLHLEVYPFQDKWLKKPRSIFQDEDEDTFTSTTKAAPRRMLWLGVNLLTALAASSVIGQFQETIDKVIALAVLMPIVASMGGVAGTQTLTVVIRGIALG